MKWLVLFLILLPISFAQITIQNLGTTGIMQTNQEYTQLRTVSLLLNYPPSANRCRYINHDSLIQPQNSDPDWTSWELCIGTRVWEVTPNNGLKRVYYQINNSGTLLVYNDSIYYNFTGAGLDLTPPFPATVVNQGYSNDPDEIVLQWYNASDPESEILSIPLAYAVIVYDQNGNIISSFTTSNSKVSIATGGLLHGTNVFANVSVINSAGMLANTSGISTIIDVVNPTMDALYGTYTRNNVFYTIPSNTWIKPQSINFSWEASDALAGINGYSYRLSQSNTLADYIPEAQNSSSFADLNSGIYQFSVRARDAAGNWAAILDKNISIDVSAPSIPRIKTVDQKQSNITLTWTPSVDAHSGLSHYIVNLTRLGVVLQSNQTTQTQFTYYGLTDQSYTLQVAAVDVLGNTVWSSTSDKPTDFTPPSLAVYPSGLVSDEVVLRAQTNEKATCYYNISNQLFVFSFTNNTLHQHKLDVPNGAHQISIVCFDAALNSNSKIATFTKTTTNADTIIGPSLISGISKKTFQIQARSGGQPLAGEEINIASPMPYSIYDLGNGNYTIEVELGSYPYELTITSGSIIKTIAMQPIPLLLSASYEDTGISLVENKSNVKVYQKNGHMVGFAADDSIEFRSSPIKIDAYNISENLFILHTRDFINPKITELLNQAAPSFGYLQSQLPKVRVALSYEDFDIVTNYANVLPFGTHTLSIVKTQQKNQPIMLFEQKDENKIIVTSD